MSKAWELGTRVMMDLTFLELVRGRWSNKTQPQKINPEHALVDLAGLGINAFAWYFG